MIKAIPRPYNAKNERMLIKLAKKKRQTCISARLNDKKLFVPEKFGNILLLPVTASTFTNAQVLCSKNLESELGKYSAVEYIKEYGPSSNKPGLAQATIHFF